MKKISVSVIIPTRNRPAFLAQAIASVRQEETVEIEIIVIDDGSNDARAVAAVAATDARVKLIRQSQQGVAAARNAGIAVAQGDYIAFLDDDDLFQPGKLSKQVAALEASPDLGWVCTGFSFIDGEGEALPRPPILAEKTNVTLHEIAMFAFISTSSVMVRHSVLLEVGGFNTGFGVSEDYELWSRILARTQGMALREPLAVTRLHSNNHALPTAVLLRNNRVILDSIFAKSPPNMQPRDIYTENLHRIIRDNLLYKRRYGTYLRYWWQLKPRHKPL